MASAKAVAYRFPGVFAD